MQRAEPPPGAPLRPRQGRGDRRLRPGGFVLGSALFLASEAVRRLSSPQPIEQSGLGIAVLLLALLLTAALLGFQRFVVRRAGSIAIQADSLHPTT